jgi:SpoVK/Ycf46/Vps4 family AAA+-type ATPase
MSGAFANIVQMCRAHYAGDESAFATAASTLARGAKLSTFRNEIERLIRDGRSRQEARRREQWQQSRNQSAPKPFEKLPDAQNPTHGMLRVLQGPAFSDLLLPDELQVVFDEIVTELEFRNELAERGLRPRDRVLLHGPPGNGKTSSAIAIAKQLGVPCWGANLSEVFGKFLGDTSRNIQQLIESLPSNAVTVLDEIDAIGGARSAYGTQACDKEMNAGVNTLLTALDRTCHGIIVATTNRLDILDPALKRRFEEVIEIPSPTIAQKRALAARLCAGFGVNPVHVDDEENFDAVTKACKREARRIVMQEILAADAATEEQQDGEEAAE